MRSIFVQITSYHDYELEKTIRDAIAKSSGNNQINFGVHSIFYDDNKWIDPIRDIPNVKLVESKAPENLGIGLGRDLAHYFYNGEDYYFQIDAHSRFDRGWDMFLVNEVNVYKNCGYEKPIITNYPKPYWYEGDVETTRNHIEPVTQFYWKYKDRFQMYRQPMQGTIANPPGNIHSISISGGCVFTEGEFLKPNKLLFADGEEIFTAAAAYTHGYDLFVPSQTFMYHLYSDRNSEGRNRRRFVTEDWVEETYRLEAISKEEIMAVLSGDGLIGPDRLGTKRTLAEYGEYAGLDFKTGEVLRNYECP
jgi:hypothetical protein